MIRANAFNGRSGEHPWVTFGVDVNDRARLAEALLFASAHPDFVSIVLFEEGSRPPSATRAAEEGEHVNKGHQPLTGGDNA